MNPISLCIVIISYNTREHLARCLRSLRQFGPTVRHRIIVADNNSPDRSADMVAGEFPEAELIRMHENVGYGSAINRAVSAAGDAEWLLFLNPDLELTKGAVDTLLRFAASRPRIGVAGPRLLFGDGNPQSSGQRFLSATRLLFEASRIHLLLPRGWRERLFLGTYWPQTTSRRVGWVSGACHLIPGKVWDRVGPLTEETFCGFDDYDYCHRVHACGYEVWFCAEAVMTHHCSVAVLNRWSVRQVEELAAHNTYIVLTSHWPRWRVNAFCFAELIAYGTEAIRNRIAPRFRGPAAGEYRYRLAARVRLRWQLLTGREQPRRRYVPKHDPVSS